MTQNCPTLHYNKGIMVKEKPRLLLHACCAPCSSSVVERLQQDYALTLFYYNPNIHPQNEYQIRCDEIVRWCKKIDLPLIVSEYDPQIWHHYVKGYEHEPERGERCTLCYRLRLTHTAIEAKREGYDLFTTVLSISPHKDAARINQLGDDVANEVGIAFYQANFKKQGGFQRSLEISKEQGFYRQNYCGCHYSFAESERRKQQRSSQQRNSDG